MSRELLVDRAQEGRGDSEFGFLCCGFRSRQPLLLTFAISIVFLVIQTRNYNSYNSKYY